MANSTENLINEADSLLSRYRRAPVEGTEPSMQAASSEFPILTEVVAKPGIEELDKSAPPETVIGTSDTFPHQQLAVDAIDPVSVDLRQQLTLAISEVVSARLQAVSSELVATVLKVSLDALDEAVRKRRTTDSLGPEGRDGRKT